MPIEAAPIAFDYSLVPIPKNRYFVATHGITTTVCTVYLVDLLAQSHTAQQYRTVQYITCSPRHHFMLYLLYYILCQKTKRNVQRYELNFIVQDYIEKL